MSKETSSVERNVALIVVVGAFLTACVLGTKASDDLGWFGSATVFEVVVSCASGILAVVLGYLLYVRAKAQEDALKAQREALDIERRGRIDDRFKIGIEMVASSDTPVRAGGAVILRDVAIQRPEDYAQQALFVLSEVLRQVAERLPKVPIPPAPTSDQAQQISKRDHVAAGAILEAIGTINAEVGERYLRLPMTPKNRFRLANLSTGPFSVSGGSFDLSILTDVTFFLGQFERTTFSNVYATSISLVSTFFQKCEFRDARWFGADRSAAAERLNSRNFFIWCDMTDGHFGFWENTTLQYCNLTNSEISGTSKLVDCYFLGRRPKITTGTPVTVFELDAPLEELPPQEIRSLLASRPKWRFSEHVPEGARID